MKLWELLSELPYVVSTRGDMNTEIHEITSSSRDRTEGGLFFCIVGARFDAHDFAWEAVENGCVALIVEHYTDLSVPQVLVSNGRAAMARICSGVVPQQPPMMFTCGSIGSMASAISCGPRAYRPISSGRPALG